MQEMNAEIMKTGKKWDESLNKPDLDYGEIFTEEVNEIFVNFLFCFMVGF